MCLHNDSNYKKWTKLYNRTQYSERLTKFININGTDPTCEREKNGSAPDRNKTNDFSP